MKKYFAFAFAALLALGAHAQTNAASESRTTREAAGIVGGH
jgi:hypothetical protein